MKWVLTFAAIAEAATGLALLILPSLGGHLLLGAEFTGGAVIAVRVAGIALVALGVACWPGMSLVGMLCYSVLVTLYLAYVGMNGWAGVLLWPAVVVHAALTVLLILAWRKQHDSSARKPQ